MGSLEHCEGLPQLQYRQHRTPPVVLSPEYLPAGFRGAGRTRDAVMNLLLRKNGALDVHVRKPALHPQCYGVRAHRHQAKLIRDCRGRIQKALADYPFIATEATGAQDLHCTLDADALHDPQVLAQAVLATGHHTFQSMSNHQFLEVREGYDYARHIRRLLLRQRHRPAVSNTYGYVGEAVLHQVVTSLCSAVPEGKRGAVDACWFDRPEDVAIGEYTLRADRSNIHGFRDGQKVFEQDAMVLLGDAPDAIAFFDVTTSLERLKEKIVERHAFADFQRQSRAEGIQAHRVHVVLDEHLDGWCDLETGEGTRKVHRALLSAVRQARGNVEGTFIVALPYYERAHNIVRKELHRARVLHPRRKLQKKYKVV